MSEESKNVNISPKGSQAESDNQEQEEHCPTSPPLPYGLNQHQKCWRMQKKLTTLVPHRLSVHWVLCLLSHWHRWQVVWCNLANSKRNSNNVIGILARWLQDKLKHPWFEDSKNCSLTLTFTHTQFDISPGKGWRDQWQRAWEWPTSVAPGPYNLQIYLG